MACYLHLLQRQHKALVKLLANENFPKKSTEYLRKKGYDIVGIGEDYAGIEDTSVMVLADQQHRTIVTFDQY